MPCNVVMFHRAGCESDGISLTESTVAEFTRKKLAQGCTLGSLGPVQVRILAAPRTFRDTPTPEEAALYEQAAADCEEMLEAHRRRKAEGKLLLGGPMGP